MVIANCMPRLRLTLPVPLGQQHSQQPSQQPHVLLRRPTRLCHALARDGLGLVVPGVFDSLIVGAASRQIGRLGGLERHRTPANVSSHLHRIASRLPTCCQPARAHDASTPALPSQLESQRTSCSRCTCHSAARSVAGVGDGRRATGDTATNAALPSGATVFNTKPA
ncbi:hypothetical protein EJ04DRAFT_34593 [Polyplosphaeria fusca]|uniref:Uncharacterized protein n=1 Tax=Polyplosphaeria fusca TaxID=682080 RepID=A0A9P4QTC9_9PLEO|nr:hypothetical protein EJ04DRAFT_34593 [Polyplosphaeria fusca]